VLGIVSLCSVIRADATRRAEPPPTKSAPAPFPGKLIFLVECFPRGIARTTLVRTPTGHVVVGAEGVPRPLQGSR